MVKNLNGEYLKQIGKIIITIEDKTNGVSTSATLQVVNERGLPIVTEQGTK